MKIRLAFSTYLHLAEFMSVAENVNIEMDLPAKSLIAHFSEKDVAIAVNRYGAIVSEAAEA